MFSKTTPPTPPTACFWVEAAAVFILTCKTGGSRLECCPSVVVSGSRLGCMYVFFADFTVKELLIHVYVCWEQKTWKRPLQAIGNKRKKHSLRFPILPHHTGIKTIGSSRSPTATTSSQSFPITRGLRPSCASVRSTDFKFPILPHHTGIKTTNLPAYILTKTCSQSFPITRGLRHPSRVSKRSSWGSQSFPITRGLRRK